MVPVGRRVVVARLPDEALSSPEYPGAVEG